MEYTTKFNPGDEVWTIYQNKPHQFRVACVEIKVSAHTRTEIRTREYIVEHTNTTPRNNPLRLAFDARDCFATKQELIDHLFNINNG